jgi:hypothetical protein
MLTNRSTPQPRRMMTVMGGKKTAMTARQHPPWTMLGTRVWVGRDGRTGAHTKTMLAGEMGVETIQATSWDVATT